MDLLFGTLAYVSDPTYWLTVLAGIALATTAGLLPGVGSSTLMALTFPFIILYVDDPAIGIVLLATIGGCANTFDSIPAQFFGIVESGTQVTFLEGHQLTRKGQGAHAIGAVFAVSAIGGLVGALTLLLAMPIIRPFVLSFGFSEIAMLSLFGLALVGILSHGAMKKGLIGAFVGLLLASVGSHPTTGTDRFTFGLYQLDQGLPFIATILGIMALPEMIDLILTRQPVSSGPSNVSSGEIFRGFKEGLRRWRIAVRHSLLGAFLGAIPGIGGSTIPWISYGVGIALAKDRREFGKGSLDGLLFAESAENAKEGGQAIPTLALGIPGGTGWVLVLVAMLFYGITPGPSMLRDHSDIIGLVVFTLAIGNLLLTMVALVATRWIIRMTTIPYPAIGAAVIPIIILGAMFGGDLIVLPILLFFTPVGLLMKRYGWPRPPLVLALVLGPIIESNLFSALSVYGIVGVLTRPLTIGLFVMTIATVIFLRSAMRRVDLETGASFVEPNVG